jgi:hypothetical protein
MTEEVKATASKTPMILLGIGALLVIGGGAFWFVKKSSNASAQNLKNVGPSAVNGEWSEWGECVNQDGVCKKKRTCMVEAQNGGKPCSEIDGGDSERLCDPVNGNWYIPPDSTSICTRKIDSSGNPILDSEGREIWVKQKTCTNPAPCNGGSQCSGDPEERCQPINGNWSNLDEAKCEMVTDSGGTPVLVEGRQVYTKTVTCTPPQFGGSDCPNIPNSTRNGNQASIPCDPIDGVWGQWGECTTENTGTNAKARLCTEPQNGGRPCIDEYPLIPMNLDNDRGYIAQASSSLTDWKGNTLPACLAFDQTESTFWHSGVDSSNQYNASTGVYQGTSSTIAYDLQYNQKEFKGEWIQLSLPMKDFYVYNLRGFRIKGRPGLEPNRCPRQFAVLARYTSGEWMILFDNTTTNGVRDWSSAEKTFWLDNYATTQIAWDTVRLVAVTIGNQPTGGVSQDWFNLSKWSLLATINSNVEFSGCYPCTDQYAGIQASAWAGSQNYLLYRNAGLCWESAGQWGNLTGCQPMALPEGLRSQINSTTCAIPEGTQITEGTMTKRWVN